jgi:AcrR family transcriptional regulator
MNIAERPKAGRPAIHRPDQLLDRLIQAAVDILEEQAADADFSMAQLAARAKLSKRTVYTAIASKEELIFHIIRRDAQTAATILDDPLDDAAGARDVLSRFLKQWAGFACSAQAVGSYVMAIRERSRYPAIGAAYYRSRNEHGLQQLARWIARMHSKQFLQTDDAALTADFAMTMAAAERQRMLALGMTAAQTPEELDYRIDAIVRIVFR